MVYINIGLSKESDDKLKNPEFIRFVKNICKDGNIEYETHKSNSELILLCAKYFYML